MKKEDLENYTREELEDIFVNLIDDMEKDGNRYMDEWKKDVDKLEFYTYGGALLTKVNKVKTMVTLKNKVKNDKN